MVSKKMLASSLVSVAALSLASCADSDRNYRVASVGSAAAAEQAEGGSGSGTGTTTPGSGSGSGTGSGSGGTGSGTGDGSGNGTGTGTGNTANLIVASGNVLIGAASQYSQLTGSVNGTVPAGGVVNGSVSAILHTTGHTLVQLGTGTSVLLNGTGGRLGDVVSIDFGRGQVVGGPTPLIGVNVLAANPVSGSLATVNTASGNQLVGVTVLNPSTGSGSTVLAPQVAPLVGLQPVNASVTSTVSATVNAVLTPR